MKKLLCASALMFTLACGGRLMAQQPQEMGPGGEHHGGGMMMSTDQRLQRMTHQLDLTSEQQTKIRPILEQESSQMQALHQDSSLTPQEMHAKMQQIRQTTNDQIKAQLTSEQQQKFEQMQMRRPRGPMGGPGGQQSPPPEGSQPPPQQQ